MLSIVFLISALAISALVGYVTYLEDEARGGALPFKDVSLFGWLQNSHHWHDFGHFFLDMTITLVTAVLLSIVLVAFNWFSQFSFFDGISGAFLCMVPSTLLTLYIEIVADGHWRTFLGQEPWMNPTPTQKCTECHRVLPVEYPTGDTRDFLFDLFTHISGGLVAACLLSAFWAL